MRKLLKVLMVLMILLMSAESMRLYAQYDKDAFFARGRLALSDGKYAMAIENFNILSQLDTTDYWTFFFRGIAKYNLGDLRGAKYDFDRSVRLNPVFTNGYHYRGITQSRFGNYEAALSDLQRAIELRPGYIGLYFSRGVTYFLSRQFEKAISDFDRYIRKEPKDPTAYLNRGASYLFLGDTLKAVEDYNKAIRLDRFDQEGYVRRGRLYASQKKLDLAIQDMDKAIELDSTSTFAYFNRALMYYEQERYYETMDDLNKVLEYEPGNALTLYNRGLIYAQLGAYEEALSDLDRVLNINPDNVLAHFNRASIFVELGMYENAVEDYDKAIELYPDFAKAYMNRSIVKHMMGEYKASKKDYDTAMKKVKEFKAKSESQGARSLADTTQKYNTLLALDAEFAKKDFNDELLQHRDIDIKLRPLYRYVVTGEKSDVTYALDRKFENPLIARFEESSEVGVEIMSSTPGLDQQMLTEVESKAWKTGENPPGQELGLRAMYENLQSQFNSSQNYYTDAISAAEEAGGVEGLYKAFYLMNRGVLRADMIEFIASIENNVQVLSMDDSGNTRARVKDQVTRHYDYSDAIQDMKDASAVAPDIPYMYYNLGNLYCLSAEHIASLDNYTKAIELYPYMGDAYFNRGLVLIYLKDKEKGCIDLSRAGELGVDDAYGVIKKYCEGDQQ